MWTNISQEFKSNFSTSYECEKLVFLAVSIMSEDAKFKQQKLLNADNEQLLPIGKGH